MKVKVNITDNVKNKRIDSATKALVKKACRQTLLYENFGFDAEINVTFTNDEEIKKINRQFRDIDKATDVLSFPLGENGVYDINPETGAKMLGDVVISADHAENQAYIYGHGTDREYAFLTVHSVLHLLGYDHVNSKAEEKKMRQKQRDVLEKMGLIIN